MKVSPSHHILEGVYRRPRQKGQAVGGPLLAGGAGEKCICDHATPRLSPVTPGPEIEEKDSACMGEAVTLIVEARPLLKEGRSSRGSGQPEQAFSSAAGDHGGRRIPEEPGQLQAVETR